MIILGQYCNLVVSKKVEFGYYLKDKFGDEVLLPNCDCLVLFVNLCVFL